jgi:hypothetical protein
VSAPVARQITFSLEGSRAASPATQQLPFLLVCSCVIRQDSLFRGASYLARHYLLANFVLFCKLLVVALLVCLGQVFVRLFAGLIQRMPQLSKVNYVFDAFRDGNLIFSTFFHHFPHIQIVARQRPCNLALLRFW